MLKLAEIIKERLRTKQAEKKEKREKKREEKQKKKGQNGINPTNQSLPVEETLPPLPKVKKVDEVGATISLIEKEIESLKLTTDEEEKICRIGNLATLHFKDLEGCNPVMAAAKVMEAVKKSLLKKYDVEPEEVEKKLEGFKKKFRAFGTHYYIHVLREKM